MHYLADYGLFFAKVATLVIAFLIVLGAIVALLTRGKAAQKGHLVIKKLNEKYAETEENLQQQILPKKQWKAWHKQHKKQLHAEETREKPRPRVYVLHFEGDIRASAVDALREEITAVLSVATPQDEVIVTLESAGGMVHAYGLAASQLQRIKEKNIPLTVIVDKVAASGGYLMACVGNKILAAPFAIIGSIGVVAQIPNFHRWLQKNQIDFEQITAGQYKRTLTVFGENTEQGREKFRQELEEIHHYFKVFIQQNRVVVDVDHVANGEHWLASKALELKLVDGLTTSDDYLFSASKNADIFAVNFRQKKSLGQRFSHFFTQLQQHFFMAV